MHEELRLFLVALALNKDKAITVAKGGQFLDHKFDVSPEDFLDQAEQDYDAGGTTALLNAITNAKRAIRCQVDKTLLCFGYDAAKLKIKRKMELLTEIGVVAPRILQRVDNARNLLEHEYVNPKLQEVEDSLDVAALFIEAANRNIWPFEAHFIIANADEYVDEPFYKYKNELSFDFDSEKKHFVVSADNNYFRNPGAEYLQVDRIGTTVLGATEKVYPHILELAIAIGKEREKRIREALSKFFCTIECT